jgi:hypothetical protein
VHDVVVRAEEAGLLQAPVAVGHHALALPAGGMGAVEDAVLAREANVGFRHLVGPVVRPEAGERQGDEPLVGGERPGAKAPDLVLRLRGLVIRFNLLDAHRLRRPMAEHRPDARFDDAVERGVGHLGAAQVVAPVEDRGRAGVDLGKRAEEVGDVVVVGLEALREVAVDVGEVIPRADPVGADAAQGELPGVDVRVHEPGHHHHAARIERAVGRDLEPGPDLGDPVAHDEDIALELAQLRVHRDDRAVLDQGLHRRGF